MPRLAGLTILLVLLAAALLWWLPQEPSSSSPVLAEPQQAVGGRQAEESPAPAAEGRPEELTRSALKERQDQQAPSSVAEAPAAASVRVQVIGADGQGRRGIPLLLQRRFSWGGYPVDEQLTDEAGFATLSDHPGVGPGAEGPMPMLLGFPFPVAGASQPLAFPGDAWPQETVVLKLPETGGIEVHLLDLKGRPWPHPAEVHVAPVTLFTKKGHAIREEGIANTGVSASEGIARFPAVGLGLQLEIGIPYDSWAAWEVLRLPGPTEAGQVLTVELQAKKESAIWSMRLLDPEGKPLAQRRVSGTRKTWSRNGNGIQTSSRWLSSYQTDAEGNFAFPATDAFEGEVSELQLMVDRSAEAPAAYGAFPVYNAQARKSTDFGEHRLQLSEVLVGGEVHDPSGHPIRASLSLSAPQGSPIGQELGLSPEFATVPDDHAVDLGEGRFEAYGISKAAVLRLKVEAPGFLPQVIDVNRGSRDLHLVLAPDLGIPGRLVAPSGFSPTEFRVRFRAGLEPPTGSDWWHEEQEATPDEQGQFRIGELEEASPGYLAVFHRDSPMNLLQVEQVIPIGKEETEDARLNPLELPPLHRFQVQASGPGDDSPQLKWSLLDYPELHDNRFGYAFSGDFGFVLAQEQARVGILADGFRYQEATVVPGENRIELQRAPLVQFQALDLPTLPKGLRYSIELDARDGPDMLDLTTSLPEGIGGGVFPAPMPASGAFTVRLKVRNRKTGHEVAVLEDGQPWAYSFTIAEEAAGQLIDVPIPVHGIQDAIRDALAAED